MAAVVGFADGGRHDAIKVVGMRARYLDDLYDAGDGFGVETGIEYQCVGCGRAILWLFSALDHIAGPAPERADDVDG